MSLRVAVLGCGPSGLVSVHAAVNNGCDVDIYSKYRKSQLFGSQYLHSPIPGMTRASDSVTVTYVNNGSPHDYRRKAHGAAWDGIVAPEDFETEHLAWNIRECYDKLWGAYHYFINPLDISGDVGELDTNIKFDSYDLVVSSLPRPVWSVGRNFGDRFVSSKGWALGDAPEEGRMVPYQAPDNTIICDGTADVAYTRLSRVFGYTTVEWPHRDGHKPPVEGVAEITRPLKYEPGINNPADQFLHVGRFGTWTKGVLVTDAYDEVDKATR